MAARRPLVAIGGQIQELSSADSVIGAISSPTVTSIVKLTQAAYNALSPPDANTLYLIEGNTGLTGASAYDVAVTNGFVGTEAAWLASLVGAPGAAGTQIAVSTTAPASPVLNQLWVDTN